ncbi:hypothetical protein M885DRAFT_512142 [Pelagophyceae sp. CCMP2097]|nr:hypothetical protein M885DRAFT_512142 [Pelagophyceae sp. CCMP2097]
MELPFPAPTRSTNELAATMGESTRVRHPLEARVKQNEREAKLYDARVMYGSALAMRLASEDAMACEVGRLPGLPSSNVMFETVRGIDEQISFADILNIPQHAPEAPRVSIHALAERQFGITDDPRIFS